MACPMHEPEQRQLQLWQLPSCGDVGALILRGRVMHCCYWRVPAKLDNECGGNCAWRGPATLC